MMIGKGWPNTDPSWTCSFPQLALPFSPAGPSPNPSPEGRGVICEVTPIGLLAWVLVRFFSHRTHRFNRPL